LKRRKSVPIAAASEKYRERLLRVEFPSDFWPDLEAAKACWLGWGERRVSASHWQYASGTLEFVRQRHPPYRK
jgi:hypothetical protein